MKKELPLRLLLAAAALLACIFTALPTAQAATAVPRDTTYVERSYVGFALDQKNPDICAKISPLALETAHMALPGHEIFYTRSNCYMQMALWLQKPQLCGAVATAQDTFFLRGWYFTQKNCEKLAKSEKPIIPSFIVEHEIIMNALGYIQSERNGRSWAQFYLDIRENQDKSLALRISKMPDFSKAVLETTDDNQ